MDCAKFQELINDFVFDKIDYSEDLEEFLEHAKTCQSCNEELTLYYTIHRGLGDAPPPEGSEEDADPEKELEHIKSFYEEHFEKQKFMKKAGRISIVIFILMVMCACMYVYARWAGIL